VVVVTDLYYLSRTPTMDIFIANLLKMVDPEGKIYILCRPDKSDFDIVSKVNGSLSPRGFKMDIAVARRMEDEELFQNRKLPGKILGKFFYFHYKVSSLNIICDIFIGKPNCS
jgi:hypothetical protein